MLYSLIMYITDMHTLQALCTYMKHAGIMVSWLYKVISALKPAAPPLCWPFRAAFTSHSQCVYTIQLGI